MSDIDKRLAFHNGCCGNCDQCAACGAENGDYIKELEARVKELEAGMAELSFDEVNGLLNRAETAEARLRAACAVCGAVGHCLTCEGVGQRP